MLGRMKNERAAQVSGASVGVATLITEHTPLAIDDGGRELADISDEVLLAEGNKEESNPTVSESQETNPVIVSNSPNEFNSLVQPASVVPDQVVEQSPVDNRPAYNPNPEPQNHYVAAASQPGSVSEPVVSETVPGLVTPSEVSLPETPNPVVGQNPVENISAYNPVQQNHQVAAVDVPVPVSDPVVSEPDVESAPVVANKDDDESGLYSIRNFSV